MVIIAVMLSILIYNVLSGFRGTVQTDFAQWIIMSIMLLIMAVFVVAKWPVWTSKYTTIFNAPAGGIVSAFFNPDGKGYIPYVSFCLSNIIFWGLWWRGAMDRVATLRCRTHPSSSLNSIWGTIGVIPVAYFGILTFVFLAPGVWLRVNQPDTPPISRFYCPCSA